MERREGGRDEDEVVAFHSLTFMLEVWGVGVDERWGGGVVEWRFFFFGGE